MILCLLNRKPVECNVANVSAITVEDIEEGSEPDEFWELLGGKKYYCALVNGTFILFSFSIILSSLSLSLSLFSLFSPLSLLSPLSSLLSCPAVPYLCLTTSCPQSPLNTTMSHACLSWAVLAVRFVRTKFSVRRGLRTRSVPFRSSKKTYTLPTSQVTTPTTVSEDRAWVIGSN